MRNRSEKDEQYILKRRYKVKRDFEKMRSLGFRASRAHVLLANKYNVCLATILNDLKSFKKYGE